MPDTYTIVAVALAGLALTVGLGILGATGLLAVIVAGLASATIWSTETGRRAAARLARRDPRFERTDEVFLDHRSGKVMRVYADPRTGERRYGRNDRRCSTDHPGAHGGRGRLLMLAGLAWRQRYRAGQRDRGDSLRGGADRCRGPAAKSLPLADGGTDGAEPRPGRWRGRLSRASLRAHAGALRGSDDQRAPDARLPRPTQRRAGATGRGLTRHRTRGPARQDRPLALSGSVATMGRYPTGPWG